VVRILSVDPVRPDPETVAAAVAVFRAGGLVVFPTETVYGIALDADNPGAVRRLYELKGRRGDKPLARLLADPREAKDLVPARWKGILSFWPGPLTLVLPGKDGAEGYRCPDQALERALARLSGVKLAATSANLSGSSPVSTGAEAAVILKKGIDLMLDGGRSGGGTPSTVLDLTGPRPVLRRRGPVGLSEIAECLGEVPVLSVAE